MEPGGAVQRKKPDTKKSRETVTLKGQAKEIFDLWIITLHFFEFNRESLKFEANSHRSMRINTGESSPSFHWAKGNFRRIKGTESREF